MKYSNLQAFEKHLQGSSPDHFSKIYVVIGKDRFERKQAVNSLVKYLCQNKDQKKEAVKVFDAGNAQVQDLLTELNSFSFFSTNQIIHLQQVERLSVEQTKLFDTYLTNPNPKMTLIISAEAINSSTNFYKHLEKAGIILDLVEEKAWEKEKRLQDWVYHKISQAGKKVSPQICQQLVKTIGPDSAALSQEIEKLICYIGERPEIAVSDIQAICSQLSHETIWQLGEAIFRRDAKAALLIAGPMLEDRGEFIPFIRQIRYQLQTEYQICCILAQGGGHSQVSAEYPYMKGAILDKRIQQAQHYGLERCRKGLLLIDETELKAKNYFEDYTTLGELLIAKLTGVGTP